MSVIHGDCIEAMAAMEAESIDAICTDPPYGLEFMGKEWDKLDAGLPQENVWKGRRGKGGASVGTDDSGPASRHHVSFSGERAGFKRCSTCGKRAFSGSPCRCAEPVWVVEYNVGPPSGAVRMQRWHQQWAEAAYRVAKPSAYLLAFGGTRTVHRMTCALEDAGWIIRDQLCWGFATGFPKSKASLKPAYEPIVWAQKPFSVMVESCSEIHHALAALVWLTEGAPEGVGCVSDRVASLFADSDETATSKLRAVASTSSNIASSWGSILAALSDDGSRSTTSTATSPTTALRTLSSCLSPVTSATIMPPCACLRGGSPPSANTAEGRSSDEHTRWLATLRRSVPESAIGPLAQAVAGVCASIAADLSDDQAAASTAPKPATTSHAAGNRAAWEPIVMARKPGPLRMLAIDACRIPAPDADLEAVQRQTDPSTFAARGAGHVQAMYSPAGRWPANVILTDPIFDGGVEGVGTYSRFFLIPKADRGDREPVLGGLPLVERANGNKWTDTDYRVARGERTPGRESGPRSNTHPTVKPVDLMRHLVRLVTPTGGLILDPFLGSGTTGLAAEMEGFPWIGIEREAEYVAIAEARLNGTQRGLGLETA